MEDGKPDVDAPPPFQPTRSVPVPLILALTALGLVGAVLLFVFDPAQHALYPVCLFKKTTGYDCPGCGGLRAVHHLLRGDLWGAFQLNAMAVIALPLLVLWAACAWWKSSQNKPGGKASGFVWIWLIIAAFVIFGVVRNLPIWPFGVTPG